MLAAGANGQVLTLASGVPSWATPTVGTVTSVGGTGTVSGITLSGTVTSSGNLTLGGTLDLSAPPAIGNTTANTVRGTTVTATTKFVGPFFDAATSAGGALRNAGGTAQLQWGGGGGDNLTLNVSTNINGANAQIDISPTGTGHVHIKPAGAGSVEIAPTNAGTINNRSIGATTAASGKFTTIDFSGTLAVSGVTGTAGQVLQSNGSSAPTWVTPVAYATVTDDTTTNGTRYPLFANQTSGNLATVFAASTKYQFNPSTGVLTATGFAGAGTGLTGLPAGELTGTIPSTVLGNSSLHIGTTTIALNRASAVQSLTGVSIDGSAGSAASATNATNATNFAVTDDTTTNADYFPVWVTNSTGNLPARVSSTKLKFNPSTGIFTATGGTGGGNF
jgi:mucin-19